MKKFRQIEAYKHYFEGFFAKLPDKLRDKFIWTFQLMEELETVPETYLKHLEDGIYEIRVRFGSNAYRVLCFFQIGQLLILANAFQKKTRKTPRREIQLAKKIRKEYEQENK